LGTALAQCLAEGGAGEPENAMVAVERLYQAKGSHYSVVVGIGGGEGASVRHVRTRGRACGGRAWAVVDGSTRRSSVEREGQCHGGEIEKKGTTVALRESMERGACRRRKRKPPSKPLDVHM